METFFRVTGPLCGEFTGYRWIPLTKASDAEAGDLGLHFAHYDVTVMSFINLPSAALVHMQ